MADYFEEMGWEPLGQGQSPNQLLHLARLLRDCGIWELLDQGHNLAPPASKSSVLNLEEKQVTSSGDQCPVCLKEYSVGETVKVMPCKHAFHASCILPWLKKTNSCPLCRHELPTDDEVYELYRKEKLRAKQREADILFDVAHDMKDGKHPALVPGVEVNYTEKEREQ